MREFPSEVLLQIFSHLPRSDWKSIRRLSKAWSVTAAKYIFDEIRVGPSDRAISSLRALSDHEYLREIPARLRVEAKLVEPNLSIHEFFQCLLRQIRLCSQCWGWPPSSEAILPGSDAILTHASRPLPLNSAELVWREGEFCAASAVRSRYKAYLDSVNQQQRWTASRQRDLLRCALAKLPNIRHVMFIATWLTIEALDKWSAGRGGLLLELEPVNQAPVGDYFSELIHILGSSSHNITSLTMEINGKVTIINRSRSFLQQVENFTVRLGPYFRAEDVSPLIDLIRSMTRLQTLDVQFSSCNGASDTSLWALQELLEMPTCTSPRLTRLCLMKGVVLLDDLVDFARRQPMVQEIVLSDSVIIQRDGNATPTTERTQSFWFQRASSMEPHNGYIKVSTIFP